MKFVIFANSPLAPTGYGVQCAQLAVRLKREGHDVAIACTWGHQVGVKNWETPHGPVRMYPSGVLENSLDIVGAHIDHFFQGDRKAGYVIVINDVWALTAGPFEDYKVLAWTPVDHFPVPEGVLRFFHKTNATPIAMSRFGERMLTEAGLAPLYAPLTVDFKEYLPTYSLTIDGERRDARTVFGIPQEAFAVLMVAMNKDPQDRKGFNEAFRAFGAFWRKHQNSVLVVHTDRFGIYGSGINLHELARHCAIPPHALIFTDAYAHRVGFSNEMMAALYTACDVLVAPSKGEGFGVPMIESQACGTPVVASDFTAQTELVGPGWLLDGQLEWDAPQAASYLKVFHDDLLAKLEQVYASNLPDISQQSIEFARQYDVDTVFEQFWKPILADLEPRVPIADKPMMERVDVIVPMVREQNARRLLESFDEHSPDEAHILVGDIEGDEGRTYAQNVNLALAKSHADWVLVIGDDIEFTPGWFEAAQKLTDRFDVIGTNDSLPGRIRNPAVANGSHADHFFIRRSYIDDLGSSLDGPGILAPECYTHWWVDKEIIELARARGVFSPCLDSVIVHHHPGYDGNESARDEDPLYRRAVEHSAQDRKTWLSRVPLIQALRVAK